MSNAGEIRLGYLIPKCPPAYVCGLIGNRYRRCVGNRKKAPPDLFGRGDLFLRIRFLPNRARGSLGLTSQEQSISFLSQLIGR